MREAVKSRGMPVLGTEGEDNGEWIIVDCGAAVAHIMQPAIRDYYHLEEIWGGKPVRMKIDGEARPLAAAPAPTEARAGKPAAPKRTAAKAAAAKKTAGEEAGTQGRRGQEAVAASQARAPDRTR